MFYKASETSTSTRDWFSLSFDSIPWALLAPAAEEGEIDEEIPEEPEEPEEPCEDDFASADDFTRAMAKYEAAYEAWKEEHEAWDEIACNAGSAPMWGTVFASSDLHHNIGRTAALASGCRLMVHPEVGAFIAIDGAGYSFYGAHWIPLRARIAAEQVSQATEAERRDLCLMLARELRAEGEGSGDPVGVIGGLLGLFEDEIAEIRPLLGEQ